MVVGLEPPSPRRRRPRRRRSASGGRTGGARPTRWSATAPRAWVGTYRRGTRPSGGGGGQSVGGRRGRSGSRRGRRWMSAAPAGGGGGDRRCGRWRRRRRHRRDGAAARTRRRRGRRPRPVGQQSVGAPRPWAAWAWAAMGVVALGRLEELRREVDAPVDERARRCPPSTAATSSPDSVLYVSRAWATASTSRRFSCEQLLGLVEQPAQVRLDPVAELGRERPLGLARGAALARPTTTRRHRRRPPGRRSGRRSAACRGRTTASRPSPRTPP